MSLQEYSKALAKAIKPLESALKGLAKAKAYKGLDDRVAAVESGADQAVTELSPITPPPEVAKEHPQLVTALQGFRDELSEVGSQVGNKALCTGSAVRAGMGDADPTSALRDALAAVTAKLPKPRLTLTLPAADQEVGSRPPNGKLIRAGDRDGPSALQIDNGGSNDALVTLSKGSKPAISVYVRKGKETTVRGVPNGSYAVYFTFGAAWDGSARAFGRNCAFQRFRPNGEDQLTFANNGWVITLERVVGGNSPTDDVDPDDFPDS